MTLRHYASRMRAVLSVNLVSAAAAIAAAIFTFNQITTARSIAQANIVIEYYKLLNDDPRPLPSAGTPGDAPATRSDRFTIAQHLAEGGRWSTRGAGPADDAEWFELRRYMGLLEQIEVMIKQRALTADIADANYSHRIWAVYRNDRIRTQLLTNEAFRWQLFRRLVCRMESMPVFSELRAREVDVRRETASLPSLCKPWSWSRLFRW